MAWFKLMFCACEWLGCMELGESRKYTVAQKERIFFSNNCNFLNFQYKKKYVNIKTTCNKCSFDYLHWLFNYGKLYRKDGILLAVHTSGASPQSSASYLLTFIVAQLQFLREWKLSDRRLYEIFERRLLIRGNPKEINRRQIKKHAFFLRHPVHGSCISWRKWSKYFWKWREDSYWYKLIRISLDTSTLTNFVKAGII